jgi:hypothetical protein
MEGGDCETVIRALLGKKGVVKSLLQPDDLFGCVTFNTTVQKLHHPMELANVDLAKDETHIRSNTDSGGCTAIYDAIATGIADLRSTVRRAGRRGLCVEHLLFTDGSDNMSSTSFEDICTFLHKEL